LDLDWSRWRSCHLYYHGDAGLLLRRLVRPLVASLLRADEIDHFFFIRYELGGPHVRLRLRASPGAAGAVEAAVKTAAESFFARWPSPEPQAPERVLRRTRETLAADPSETDATLYPDNCLRLVPFTPQVERYGGAGLIGDALDFFALSSVRALGFAQAFDGEPRSRQIPGLLRALAAQAAGLAGDATELPGLLGYAAIAATSSVDHPGGHPLAPFAERGDRAFEQQPEAFRHLLREACATGTDEAAGRDEARRLASGIRRAAPPASAPILKSHLHMTANRLGIRNPEEAFLSRILWRAAHDATGPDRGLQEDWRTAFGSLLDVEERLEDLLPAAFATVMETDVAAASEASALRGR
jgi:hypothetical protein